MSQPTAPSERILCSKLSSVLERLIREAAAVKERQINKKIQTNKNLTIILL